MISNIEMTEIFNFYAATSYTSGVHGLDYGNSPKGFLLIIEADLTETGH